VIQITSDGWVMVVEFGWELSMSNFHNATPHNALTGLEANLSEAFGSRLSNLSNRHGTGRAGPEQYLTFYRSGIASPQTTPKPLLLDLQRIIWT
jgi:hypothetical protein